MRAMRNLSHLLSRLRRVRLGVGQYQRAHYDPKGHSLAALQPDSQVLDSLNTCTTCGICTENCPAGVNPPEMIESARRQLVSNGAMTRQQADLSRNIFASGNTFGDARDRLSWLTDRSLLKKKADYVYFVGCMNSYRYTETAANTFALLHRFGATMLPAEQCCGSPLLRTGFDARQICG